MGINWSNILTLSNLLDILVVWFIIYEVIILLKGTKAVQLFRGVLVIAVVKIVSVIFGFTTVSYLTDQVINWGVIAIIVIFQPEIRRGLEHLGRGSIIKHAQNQNVENEKMILELDKAIQYMSKRRIGALMTIQMDTGLEDYIETGIKLDADITGELLINTFIPNTPLHDGAVIISNNRVAVAAAYLPLSQSNLIPKELGTRHRAAVGISEVTDALTIVISEETGEVSITKNNELLRGMNKEDYMKFLRDQLITKQDSMNKNLFTTIFNWFDKIKQSTGGQK
ncbi:Diadenylate cyclase [Apilactobacillus kunkeei]|uniref:diadenylate cyclase CdaA n=1 Tax=Apilactobacillus nanyangensis TaxID=2799579 RepID=UPI00110C8A4E|nr:diadenylate cyclase CdaA [Apilactobacillus nanyangensis]TMT02979.1 TIGR00159 family protein [Apilactobacillus kunkeei]TMT04397.1 TIGR00159 family protein [Apilactobacillus kunkeei]CAI2646634.1 Diadenylate cyclase [Apilactobacillus kunkeei]